jgi:hypothetical protein
LSLISRRFSILISFQFFSQVMAQDDSPFNFSEPKVPADFVLSEIISSPKEAARARKEGGVVYQIKIDSSGNLVSSKLVEETHPIFKEEAQKAMKYLGESWYPELLGLKAPGENSLVVMIFANLNLQVDPADRLAQASRLIDNGKAEKAIPILTRLIEDYPYGEEYYETKAKVFALIRENEEFKKDTQQIFNLEKRS